MIPKSGYRFSDKIMLQNYEGGRHEALYASRFDDEPPGTAVHGRERSESRRGGDRPDDRRAFPGALRLAQSEQARADARRRRLQADRELRDPQITRRELRSSGVSEGPAA